MKLLWLYMVGYVFTAQSWAAVDYLREVKPVLTEHCYKCHGARQQKSGLRLDTAALAIKGGENGPSLKPGQSATSLIIQTVRGAHESIALMPYKKPPLAEPQIAMLAQWIDEGAKAPSDEQPEQSRHWAFEPPQRAPLPKLPPAQAGARNGIDSFIRARLEERHITPAPEADRTTLLRRLSLDLTGLPPTPREVESFLKDTGSNAYERVVERLLA